MNVYASCTDSKKEELWRLLMERRMEDKEGKWCICGDLNAVRNKEERRGRAKEMGRRSTRCFNGFIREAELLDIPLCRRKFTNYKKTTI